MQLLKPQVNYIAVKRRVIQYQKEVIIANGVTHTT
nr:MAG TPA: hypothetical protein [Caudoviricetes sp.]